MAVADNLVEHLDACLMQKLRITLFIDMNTVFFQVSKELETHILSQLYIFQNN